MNADYIFVFAAGIGFVAGLRSLTAPAAVSWAAHLGFLPLQHSPSGIYGIHRGSGDILTAGGRRICCRPAA